jgi:hypothetical protein
VCGGACNMQAASAWAAAAAVQLAEAASSARFIRAADPLRTLLRRVRCMLAPIPGSHLTFTTTPPPSLQAAMEVLFLESSVQLLEEFSDEFFQHREFITFYDNMLQWVARAAGALAGWH